MSISAASPKHTQSNLIQQIRDVLQPIEAENEPREVIGDLPGIRSNTPAAVLIALLATDTGLELLLTVRSDHLSQHAGQISFPGGRMDGDDGSWLATALRESQEEVGLIPSMVEPLGFLGEYRTITGYRVVPVVGYVREMPDLRRQPDEVAEIFTMPLSHVLEGGAIRSESAKFRGSRVKYFVIDYNGYRIWGATAAMIRQLVNKLEPG